MIGLKCFPHQFRGLNPPPALGKVAKLNWRSCTEFVVYLDLQFNSYSNTSFLRSRFDYLSQCASCHVVEAWNVESRTQCLSNRGWGQRDAQGFPRGLSHQAHLDFHLNLKSPVQGTLHPHGRSGDLVSFHCDPIWRHKQEFWPCRFMTTWKKRLRSC